MMLPFTFYRAVKRRTLIYLFPSCREMDRAQVKISWVGKSVPGLVILVGLAIYVLGNAMTGVSLIILGVAVYLVVFLLRLVSRDGASPAPQENKGVRKRMERKKGQKARPAEHHHKKE